MADPTPAEIELLRQIVAVHERRLRRYEAAQVGRGVTADDMEDAELDYLRARLELERARPTT